VTFLSTVLAFVVTLGVLITIHELGHYWVARRLGVKILRFSLGFGRPLWRTVRGADRTEWVIAALPLGGYVRMLDERDPDAGPVAPQDLPRAFNRQSLLRRSAIVLAGPAANLLLAVLVYWGLNLVGTAEPRAVVAAPAAQSAAARAGVQEGDTFTAIDGTPVATWNDLRWRILDRAIGHGPVAVEVTGLDGEARRLTLDLSAIDLRQVDQELFERIGLTPGDGLPVVYALAPDAPAQRAGLQVGDRIRAIDGVRMDSAREVRTRVRAAPLHPLVMRIERSGTTHDVEVVPAAVGEGAARAGRIGVDFRDLVTVRYGLVDGLVQAVVKVRDTAIFSLRMLGKMLTGEASWRNLSGPVTIADYAGQTARVGLIPWLGFLALVSISLGVLNLLPIPMLDGGHLLYYVIETVRGSPPPERWVELGHRFGFAVLIMLTALALYNDVARLLTS
jgi:regulator of sigma E protease